MVSALVLALLASSFAMSGIWTSSAAASAVTTSPDSNLTVEVLIRDTGVNVQGYQEYLYGAGTDLEPLSGAGQVLPRGDTAVFRVINLGTKVREFTAFGKTSGPVRPGGKASFKVILLHRGKFPYKAIRDAAGKRFHGYLTVV